MCIRDRLREDKANELANLDENAARIADMDQELEAGEEMKKIDQERAIDEAVNAEEKARREAEERAKYVDIPEPPEDELNLGSLPPPDGCTPAYCPALREGRIINGRGGVNVQIPSAAGSGAGGPAGSAAQDATPGMPEVKPDEIPADIRASLA